jgi:hypothetical protein
MSFLEELDAKCQRLLLPTIIGGDFNLNNKDISGQDFGGGGGNGSWMLLTPL